MTAGELWARLKAEDHVEGEMPEQDRPASPWYVRAMLGVAGWIGALFLIMFVGVGFAFIMDSGAFAFMLGAACCAGAFALFRFFEGNDFVEQFALAISLAGQMLLIAGLGQLLERQDAAFYLAVAATQAALALAVPNFLHRVLAAGGTAIALALTINEMALHGLAAPLLCAGLALVWMDPKLWAGSGRLWRPVGYGLVLALLLVETFRLFGFQQMFGGGTEPSSWFALHGPLLGRALTAAVLVWVTAALLRRDSVLPSSRIGLSTLGASLLFGLLSLQMPGLASASLILLLGFAVGNRLLVALGILSLLGFVSHFYYSLHATLLEKSGILAITGLALLAAYFLLRRFFPISAAPETRHA